ncbi:MAG: M56 family metallopeptidase [Longimicrobiaceae bacterium]
MPARPGEGTLVSREQHRRRALLLGVAALLVLSFGPVFGHHFAWGLEHALSGRDHLGPICLIATHEILAPVHYLFHALVVGGLLFALYDRARAWLRVRRAMRPLEVRSPAEGDAVWTAAVAAGVDPLKVRVVEGLPNPAFTVGWWSPRIFVAEALTERLSPDELAALLAHEGAHVDRRDPLRLSLLRFFAHLLFWLPALRRLAADVADEAEIQADDRAARERPLALASALLALASWQQPQGSALPDAVGFAQRVSLLDRRIRRLAGEEPAPASSLTRGSIAAAIVALGTVWISGAIMAHPLPTGAIHHHLTHCEHPGKLPFVHLVCFPDALRSRTDLCPHARGL